MLEILDKLSLDVQTLVDKEIEVFEGGEMLQFRVSSYSSFDYLISNLGNNKSFYNGTWDKYYRGVTNKDYDLTCSLCVNHLEDMESELVNSLYSRAPDKFSACKTNFEMVALMQHYGLPTRLLDFTRNPMVALWFACQKDQKSKDTGRDEDGAVYLAFSSRSASTKIVDCIFKIALANDVDKLTGLERILSSSEIYDYLSAIGLHLDHMIFLDAPIIDLRERNQQAVFLLGVNDILISENAYPNQRQVITPQNYIEAIVKLKVDSSKIRLNFGGINCYKKTRDNDKILKIIIPRQFKNQMLKELSIRGIDESFIYPTLDNYCKEIKEKAKAKNDIMDREFKQILDARSNK